MEEAEVKFHCMSPSISTDLQYELKIESVGGQGGEYMCVYVTIQYVEKEKLFVALFNDR